VEISNVYLQEDFFSVVSREQNLVVEKGRKVSGYTMTGIKEPISSFNDIEKNVVPIERTARFISTTARLRFIGTTARPIGTTVSQRLSIRISEREIEDFEIKDKEELERIRRAMEKAERVELEHGTLKEIAEGLYLGLDTKGNLLVVVL